MQAQSGAIWTVDRAIELMKESDAASSNDLQSGTMRGRLNELTRRADEGENLDNVLEARVKRAKLDSISDETKVNYASALRSWQKFAVAKKLKEELPPPPAELEQFLSLCGSESAVSQHVAAIRKACSVLRFDTHVHTTHTRDRVPKKNI